MSSRDIAKSRISAKHLPETTASYNWIRNKAWPAISEPSSSEEKFIGLWAVFPGDGTGSGGNFIAFKCQGNYTVDYGDGTTTNYTSNSTAEYDYNFSNSNLYDATVTFTDTGDLVTRNSHGYIDGDEVQFYRIVSTTGIEEAATYYVVNATSNTFQVSSSLGGSVVPLTTDGSGALLPYKVATVVITPQVGSNLTLFNVLKHSTVSYTIHKWLDIVASLPNTTNFDLDGYGYSQILERCKFISLANFSQSSYMFRGCYALEEVVFPEGWNCGSKSDYMFASCHKLRNAPFFDTSNVTGIMWQMFGGCYALENVPLYDLSNSTNTGDVFVNCYSLKTVPLFNTSSSTNMAGMFNGCNSLETVPLFDTSSATSMRSMFSNCNSLKTVPLFDTSLVTDMSSMFSGCYSLETVPLFDTSLVTDMSTIFQSCARLIEVPPFNTPNLTSLLQAFNGCHSLRHMPWIDTSNVTNMQYCFSDCKFDTFPLLDFSSLSNGNWMFRSCANLITVPKFSFPISVALGNMFGSTSSLTSIPAIDFSNATSGVNFNNNHGLSRIEATGLKYSFSVAYCNLSSTALDEIYTNLPTVTSKTITVSGNYGVSGDDPTIATAKGWTVVG